MKTVIYTAEITDVLTDEEYDGFLPKNEDGTLNTYEIAKNAKEHFDDDDVVITKVQVFEEAEGGKR